MMNPTLTLEEQTLISNHFPADTTIIDISRGMPSILAEPSFNPLYFYDATDHATASLGLAENFPAKHIRDGQRILVRHSDKASDREQLLLELSGLRFEVIAQNKTASLVDRISSNFRTALELVQSVLHHDAKDTTYKIILLTALNLIANQRLDLHPKDRDVTVPLDLLMKEVFKLNLPLYWNTSRPPGQPYLQGPKRNSRADTAIGKAFAEYSLGDLNYLEIEELLSHALFKGPAQRSNRVARILKEIDKTFRDQPIPRIGSELKDLKRRLKLKENEQILRVSEDEQHLQVPDALWDVFVRLGPTLHSIFINHWAIMICRFTEDAKIQEVLFDLNFERQNSTTRTGATEYVRSLIGHDKLTCYLSGNLTLKIEIDHILPWVAFRINSLWNLMPLQSNLNSKKSDSPLSAQTLRDAKTRIIKQWNEYLENDPQRFKREALTDTGIDLTQPGSLEGLFEHLERLNHRYGLQRPSMIWSPA